MLRVPSDSPEHSGFSREVHVLIICTAAVNHAVISKLDDTVGDSLCQLVVMTGKEDVMLESFHSVIQSGNALVFKR